jgi:hypothetical protein
VSKGWHLNLIKQYHIAAVKVLKVILIHNFGVKFIQSAAPPRAQFFNAARGSLQALVEKHILRTDAPVSRSCGRDIPLSCPSSSALRAVPQLVAHAGRVKPWLARRNGG